MAGWAGFTDDDLKQLKQTTSPGPPSQQTSRQHAMARKQKVLQQRQIVNQRTREFSQGQNSTTLLPSEQCLSRSDCSQEKAQPLKEVSSEPNAQDMSVVSPRDIPGEEKETVTDVKEIDEKEAISKELSRVEQFQQQQQKMEEENHQRRRLLAEAIKQRSKMARAEAEKLTKVQKELNHLDTLVNADVAIIRDRIEAASLDFMQAQKRYERAEKEFVTAKMFLAEKSEVKEALTEHLYTIIQQNELRKAERLATLMKELGMEGEGTPFTVAPLPPLLSFSSLNTLHRQPSVSAPPPPASSCTSLQSALPHDGAASGGGSDDKVDENSVSLSSLELSQDTTSPTARDPSVSLLCREQVPHNVVHVPRTGLGGKSEDSSPECQDGGADEPNENM